MFAFRSILPCELLVFSCWNYFQTIFHPRHFASLPVLPIVLLWRQKHFDLHISAIMIQDLLRQIWLMILWEFLYHLGKCTMEFFLEQHIFARSCIETLSHSGEGGGGYCSLGRALCDREKRFIILMLVASIAHEKWLRLFYDRKKKTLEENRLNLVLNISSRSFRSETSFLIKC